MGCILIPAKQNRENRSKEEDGEGGVPGLRETEFQQVCVWRIFFFFAASTSFYLKLLDVYFFNLNLNFYVFNAERQKGNSVATYLR